MLWMLGAAAPWVHAAEPLGRRIALVIGNGNYAGSGMPRLANPGNDAEDMARVLRTFGFEVIERKDQTLEGMQQAVAEFGSRLGGSDVALFYFAGHGLQVRNRNYLIPVTARIDSEASVPYQGLSVDQVLDEMDNGKSRVNIVLLDACRNNPITGKFRSGASRGLASPGATPKGTVVVYATDPGNVAADGDGRNGLFTSALLNAFKGQDLSLDGVLTAASAEVERQSGQTQTPYVNGPKTLQKNFNFSTSTAPVAASATATQPPNRPALPPGPFDGRWAVNIVCDDTRDKENRVARGYTVNLIADVVAGRLTGSVGTPGKPGSLQLEGTIQPDGGAYFSANGYTGNPDVTVGRLQPGNPYSYHMNGRFGGSSGLATRVELRPCEARFTRR